MDIEKFITANESKIRAAAAKNAELVFSSNSNWYADDMWNDFAKDVTNTERKHQTTTATPPRRVVSLSTISG